MNSQWEHSQPFTEVGHGTASSRRRSNKSEVTPVAVFLGAGDRVVAFPGNLVISGSLCLDVARPVPKCSDVLM